MSDLITLIAKYCPDGVSSRPLLTVSDFKRGQTITKSVTVSGDVPVLAGGQKPAYWHDEANRFGETVVIAGSGAYAGFVSFWNVPVWVSDAFTVKGRESILLQKYLYYFLKSKQGLIHNKKRGSGVPHVYGSDLADLMIPVPPIQVQAEIIRILDTFTQLEAELEAELEARRKQYEYYRNQLLSFPEQGGVRWVPMGEVGQFIRGNALQKKDFVDSGKPCIHYGQIYTYYNSSADRTKSFVSDELYKSLKKAPPGSLIMTTTSENIQDVCKSLAWLGKESVAIGGHSCVFVHDLNPMFVSFFTQSRWFQDQKDKYVKGTKVKDISLSDLSKVLIPVPDIKTQDSIAIALASFEGLVSGASESIPSEIKARRQQYEHYRDKLLTFKELQA